MKNNLNKLFYNFKYCILFFVVTILFGCGGGGGGNSDKNEVAQTTAAYSKVLVESSGISVGPPSMTNPVYVLFDPQCPHCTNLWGATLPLQNKIKFIWIPVAILGNKSKDQGMALLSAANPMIALTNHELSMKDNLGGILIPSAISADFELKIRKNTELLNFLGINSVPIIVAKHQITGREIIHVGSMTTSELLIFLGANQ
jgi:thiol:disulfide interchange protein DsbG